jgi:hypothetical protein
MPRPTSEVRLAEAKAKMQAGCLQLHHLMRERHPEPGCIPVPKLTIPGSKIEASQYMAQLAAAMDNSDGKWSHAHDNCPHTPGYAIRGIWSAWRKWQGLMCAADRYVTRKTRTSAEMNRYLNELYVVIATLTQPAEV